MPPIDRKKATEALRTLAATQNQRANDAEARSKQRPRRRDYYDSMTFARAARRHREKAGILMQFLQRIRPVTPEEWKN